MGSERRRTGADPHKLRGRARMRQRGFHLVEVWLHPSEVFLFRVAAKQRGERLATAVRRMAWEWWKEKGKDT